MALFQLFLWALTLLGATALAANVISGIWRRFRSNFEKQPKKYVVSSEVVDNLKSEFTKKQQNITNMKSAEHLQKQREKKMIENEEIAKRYHTDGYLLSPKKRSAVQTAESSAPIATAGLRNRANPLLTDHERAFRHQQEEKKKEEEELKAGRRQIEKQRRAEMLEKVPEEPDVSEATTCVVLLRFPTGKSAKRRFSKLHDVQALYDWVSSEGYIYKKYALFFVHPRKELLVEEGTLEDAGMSRKVALVCERRDGDLGG